MNKINKFRIWDKEYKAFVENSASLHAFSNWMIDPFTGQAVNFIESASVEYRDIYTRNDDPMVWMNGLEFVKENRYVVQQFTGLHDREGKEIYEGDIVKYSLKNINYTEEIVFQDFCFKMINAEGSSIPLGDYLGSISQVVGNIFENPELIKTN